MNDSKFDTPSNFDLRPRLAEACPTHFVIDSFDKSYMTHLALQMLNHDTYI